MSNIQRRRNPVSGPASVAKPPMAAVNAAGITPKEAMCIVRRHILMIILFTLTGLIISLGAFVLQRKYNPQYRAFAVVEILPPGDEDPLKFGGVQPNREIYYQLRNTIARKMERDKNIDEFVDTALSLEEKWIKHFDKPSMGQQFLENIRFSTASTPKDRIVKFLKKKLSISAQRDTNMIVLSFSFSDKKDTAIILNKFLQITLDKEADIKGVENYDEKNSRIKDLDRLTGQINSLNSQLAGLRAKSNFGNLEKTTFQDYLNNKLEQIEVSNDALETSKSDLVNRVIILKLRANISDFSVDEREIIKGDELLRSRVKSILDSTNIEIIKSDPSLTELAKICYYVDNLDNIQRAPITEQSSASHYYDDAVRERIERDTIASNMRQRISLLETNLANLESRLGEGHRSVREARDTIEQAKADLDARQIEIGNIERNADLLRAQDQLIALTAQIESTESRLGMARLEYKKLSEEKAQYEKLVTIRDEKQKTLEEVSRVIQILESKATVESKKEKYKAAKIAGVSYAIEPRQKSKPLLKIYIIGGFILGLIAGAGLAFAKELLNDILRSPSDVSKHLHIPLLGMISHTDEDDSLGGVNIYHVVRQAPYSIMSECYRQLRTNLRLSESGARHRSLLVTSCNSGCGKTTTATNLAATLVAEGMRVLLIDTNFRRPSLSGLFPQNEEEGASGGDSGLSNYLLGQCSLEDVCRESGLEDLDIIDAGPLPSNPSELLSNAKMGELINQANTTYDYVIIDGPPLIVSDAKILASQVDSTIVVFNAMSTRRGEAQRSLRELREINADIAGTVLIGVRSMKGGYFQEVYKSYLQYQQVQLTGSVS